MSLQLKKIDPKHGKFTMSVTADDKTIEKKDRNVSEPIQFYSGRDHLLFELVPCRCGQTQGHGISQHAEERANAGNGELNRFIPALF